MLGSEVQGFASGCRVHCSLNQNFSWHRDMGLAWHSFSCLKHDALDSGSALVLPKLERLLEHKLYKAPSVHPFRNYS